MVLNFTQSGWTGGGTVELTVTVDDLDSNGQIMGFGGSSELLSYSVSFTGNGLVGGFSNSTLGELMGFVYDLDGGILGDGTTGAVEGFGIVSPVTYATGPGPFALCDGVQDCGQISFNGVTLTTTQALTPGELAVVPEPASAALFGLGLVGLLGLRRRLV